MSDTIRPLHTEKHYMGCGFRKEHAAHIKRKKYSIKKDRTVVQQIEGSLIKWRPDSSRPSLRSVGRRCDGVNFGNVKYTVMS